MLRLARLYPNLPEAAPVHALADAMLTAENFAVETAYLARPSARGFERPYGWAWALALCASSASSAWRACCTTAAGTPASLATCTP